MTRWLKNFAFIQVFYTHLLNPFDLLYPIFQAISSLAGLLEEDNVALDESKIIDNAWRGAEVRKNGQITRCKLHVIFILTGRGERGAKKIYAETLSSILQAYHLFLLAQRQLYEGAVDAAMKTVRVKAEFDANYRLIINSY